MRRVGLFHAGCPVHTYKTLELCCVCLDHISRTACHSCVTPVVNVTDHAQKITARGHVLTLRDNGTSERLYEFEVSITNLAATEIGLPSDAPNNSLAGRPNRVPYRPNSIARNDCSLHSLQPLTCHRSATLPQLHAR